LLSLSHRRPSLNLCSRPKKVSIISTEGMAKIRRMVLLMRLLFEDDPRITIDSVYQVVEAAYRSVDGEYGAEQARQSGMLDNGLPFSLAAVVRDGDLAQFQACDLDLVDRSCCWKV
jgi:hypothetical protein